MFKYSAEVLATTIRQEKGITVIETGREEIKLLLNADNKIYYIENPKVSSTSIL